MGISLASAQEMYSKVYDNPADAIKGHVGVELYGIDAGFSNLTGSMLFAVGVNGRYPINDKLQAEGLIRMPLLRFEKKGFSFMTDAGVLWKLSSKEAPKDVNVILGYKETDNINSNTRTATTKYVSINGNVRSTQFARGGIYLRNSAFDYKSDGITDYMLTNIFHKGVYLGLARERQYYFQMQRKQGDRIDKFGAGSIFQLYADVLLLPVNVDVTIDTFGFGAGATESLNGLLGGRVGFKWYRNAFTRAQNGDQKIPFFGNSFFTFEAGSRPLEGFYVSGGFTYIVHKF